MIKNGLFFLFLLLSTSAAGAQKSQLDWLNGTWTGQGSQPNAAQQTTWSVNMSFHTESKSFVIEYASLGCKSTWKLVSATKQKAVFKEKITEGFGECVDNCLVVIKRLKNNQLSIYFYYGNEKETPNATVVAKKQP